MITTQPLESDFADIAGSASPNMIKTDHANGSIGSFLSHNFVGKRFSLYVGQLTWVSDMNSYILKVMCMLELNSGQQISIWQMQYMD